MSTKSKFTLIMVLTSLIGAIVFGLLSFMESRESLREAAFDELTAIRTARMEQVETYFQSIFDETTVISESPLAASAVVAFREAFNLLNAEIADQTLDTERTLKAYYENSILPETQKHIKNGTATYTGFSPKTIAGRYLQKTYLADNPHKRLERQKLNSTSGNTTYERVHEQFHAEISHFGEVFDYYDMMLIDHVTGDILYSMRKEVDYGTNIYVGPFRGSTLGATVDRVKNDPSSGAVYMSDLNRYLASNNLPSFFVASSITDNEKLLGILAIQVTNDDLNHVMIAGGNWKEIGLKDTGETYAVGSDFLLRSNSRFAHENFDAYIENSKATNPEIVDELKLYNSAVLVQEVKTEAIDAALSGVTDTRVITDYRGEKVLSSFAPIRIQDNRLAFVAEIDAEEAFRPVTQLMTRTAITTAIVIPLSAIAGIWLSSMLMRPAREMADTANNFLNGDEDVRFEDDRKGEWGKLSKNMNTVLDTAKVRLVDANKSRDEVEGIITRLMPNAIAERYTSGEREIVSHEAQASAAVFFMLPAPELTDLNNPTAARALYEQLDDELDEIATSGGVDMLNQAGMTYVAFSGLTSPMKNHAERVFKFAVQAAKTIDTFNTEHALNIQYRIGLDSGEMFGALIGNYSMAYEIWGDAILSAYDLAHASQMNGLSVSVEAARQIDFKMPSKAINVPSPLGSEKKAKQIANIGAVKL